MTNAIRYPGAVRMQRATWLFIGGFLLAGCLHLLDNLVNTALYSVTEPAASALPAYSSTVLFALNLLVYCGLIFWWMQSLQERLLPSVGRTCMIAAAWLCLLFLLVRSAKYRLTEYGTLLEHICWYGFYVPLVGIPGLFLTTCLSMEPGRKGRKWQMMLVLVLTGVLILGVVTNDLHLLMFRPGPQNLPQGGQWSTYDVGPLWYGVYGFVILCILLGLVLLVKADRREHWVRRTLLPVLLLVSMLGMLSVSDRIMGTLRLRSPWQFAETFVFFMIGIFECCIRSRLIPFNEQYSAFFAQLKLPADITTPDLKPVFRTTAPVEADRSQREAALRSPLLLDEDTRLYGKRIASGCAFWVGDERTLHRLNEALSDANEVLESENELLRLENEQAVERIRVDARNRLYTKAAAEVYGTQKKIADLLRRLQPESPEYAQVLANILLLNAYVKRKTNLVLQAAEQETVSAQELYLALDESARFLELCRVRVTVKRQTDRSFPIREAIALYDNFELLAEAFAGRENSLMVSLNEDGLRIVAERPLARLPDQTPAQLESTVEDGLQYLTLRPKGGAV